MDIVQRLEAFKQYSGLSNSQFADKAGIPRPTLSQFLNGRNKRLSDDLTAKLHIAYPELNILWLLFGEGDMVTDANIEFSEGKIDVSPTLFDSQTADNQNKVKDEDPVLYYSPADTKENFSEQHSDSNNREVPKTEQEQPRIGSAIKTDPKKRIKSIMVFYSDNSYEMFPPMGMEI